ncbi:fibronectin type III domain-containing protein, partial [Actinoplanes sp. NPDC051633]|uniref:fibronectin type III domain-containing protein n=1 Tax=Actinoplanes sp. NPDC051633 TaxID=3155670 RepID=UPI003413CC99
MAPPLAELTARAQSLTSAGNLQAAREMLDHALDPSDTDPQRASADLATAAALHARVLIGLGDPHAARTWAGFAHAAEERLHGPNDERTIAAAATHAAVLSRIGNHGRAAHVYRDLLAALQTVDPPTSLRVLAAEADLATAEHASGHCTVARNRLRDAWTRHRDAYGDSAPHGIKMLARLAVLERECGRVAESQEHVALAQELCARYLPADHPLVQQVDGLARAPRSGKHVCGRVQQSSGPAPRDPERPIPAQPRAEPYRPAQAKAQTTAQPMAEPPTDEHETPPDNRPTDPKGTVYQQPLYLSDLHQAPGDPAGRHARADTPLPRPGDRVPEYTEEGRRVPVGSAAVGGPDRSIWADRRLPVPVDEPEPGTSRRPFILAAVLVAGVGVAAAVVAATLPRGDDGAA